MRPTTKDLAKHAGVSLATVDRVLNGRSGVRKKTIEAVNAAIAELGFERNISAANLAKSRIYRFVFLLPEKEGEFLAVLQNQITDLAKAVRVEGVIVSFQRVLSSDPHQIVNILAAISPEDIDGVAIMAPQSPQLRDASLRLSERGVHVVQFITGQPGEGPFEFVGINNFDAGATAARLLGGFCKARQGHVLVIAETMNSLDSAERRLGFDRVLQTHFPELRALPTLETYGDPARTSTIISNAYMNFTDVVGVYVMSSEAAEPMAAVEKSSDATAQTIVAHERTATTAEGLRQGRIDALIVQNPGHVVRSAVRLLKSRVDTRAPLASQENIRIDILVRENLEASS